MSSEYGVVNVRMNDSLCSERHCIIPGEADVDGNDKHGETRTSPTSSCAQQVNSHLQTSGDDDESMPSK